MKINRISPLEHKFTEKLASIALVPKMLYFIGKLPENMVLEGEMRGEKDDEWASDGEEKGKMGDDVMSGARGREPDGVRCVAIVGARRNTAYGEEVAYRAAYEAAKAGAVVVSGLAYGIDSIAHRGALDAGGATVAILGTPIDDIYPYTHKGLAEEIIARGGAVISEYGPGEVPSGGQEMKARFLMRNRLISGVSDAVLVAEAAEKSGSLNTATHALEQGRDLLVVPGNINRPMSRGCNRLIVQGALPYTAPEDLLNILFPERLAKKTRKQRSLRSDDPTERAILRLIGQGVNDGEEIVELAELETAEFNRAVTMLEIRGVVRALGANKWMLSG